MVNGITALAPYSTGGVFLHFPHPPDREAWYDIVLVVRV
jgi:hypothetical protein